MLVSVSEALGPNVCFHECLFRIFPFLQISLRGLVRCIFCVPETELPMGTDTQKQKRAQMKNWFVSVSKAVKKTFARR